MTPQLINAGTIKMNYPDNKAAEENFENLSKHYAGGVQTIRDLCDESIDIRTFLQQTQLHIKKSIQICEEAVRNRQTQIVVDNSALAARLANRYDEIRIFLTLLKFSGFVCVQPDGI